MILRTQRSWTVDSLSRFLAGLPAVHESDFFSSTRQSQIWTEYSEDLDCLFQRFDAVYATPFSLWAQKSLSDRSDITTVFYPFSGPDFIFAHLLYPKASNYILCGLESCQFDDAITLDKNLLLETLVGTSKCISHFLKHSYFLTRDLRDHPGSYCMSGVLPILLVLLSRAGCRVNAVMPIKLRPRGLEICGLRIEFLKDENISNVFYFVQDLRDEGFSEESGLFRFISTLDGPAVFSKSASYLLHEPNFSKIRNLIFSRCSVLVQDPSSIPYDLLDEGGWDVNLYGCYKGTLPIFNKYEQPNLVQAYKAATMSKPLDFGFGYLSDPLFTSLIAARRCEDR